MTSPTPDTVPAREDCETLLKAVRTLTRYNPVESAAWLRAAFRDAPGLRPRTTGD